MTQNRIASWREKSARIQDDAWSTHATETRVAGCYASTQPDRTATQYYDLDDEAKQSWRTKFNVQGKRGPPRAGARDPPPSRLQKRNFTSVEGVETATIQAVTTVAASIKQHQQNDTAGPKRLQEKEKVKYKRVKITAVIQSDDGIGDRSAVSSNGGAGSRPEPKTADEQENPQSRFTIVGAGKEQFKKQMSQLNSARKTAGRVTYMPDIASGKAAAECACRKPPPASPQTRTTGDAVLATISPPDNNQFLSLQRAHTFS